MTTGDGYLCKNEPVVHVALGASESIDRIVIDWPNGVSQRVSELPIDREVLVIEGQDAFVLD